MSNKPLEFSREVPPQQFGEPPLWIAFRFDLPDVRGPLNSSGLLMVSKFPGEWKWCRIPDLLAFISASKNTSDAASGETVQDQSARILALRDNASQLYSELSDITSSLELAKITLRRMKEQL